MFFVSSSPSGTYGKYSHVPLYQFFINLDINICFCFSKKKASFDIIKGLPEMKLRIESNSLPKCSSNKLRYFYFFNFNFIAFWFWFEIKSNFHCIIILTSWLHKSKNFLRIIIINCCAYFIIIQ